MKAHHLPGLLDNHAQGAVEGRDVGPGKRQRGIDLNLRQ